MKFVVICYCSNSRLIQVGKNIVIKSINNSYHWYHIGKRLRATYLPLWLSFARCAGMGVGGAPSFMVPTVCQAPCQAFIYVPSVILTSVLSGGKCSRLSVSTGSISTESTNHRWKILDQRIPESSPKQKNLNFPCTEHDAESMQIK